MTIPSFSRFVGIDYSGAQTPDSGLQGLRIYMADRKSLPQEVVPPPGSKKKWTRRGAANWLAHNLAKEVPTFVGIDHGFSFPLDYFEMHGLKPDWPAFLEDFCRHWPTDGENTRVEFVRQGLCGEGEKRSGNARWRRLTEVRARAKSVFHFDVPGSVAKSTHAGIPWLRFLRQQLGGQLHCWPFDGWDIPPNCSALAEVYPSLWKGRFSRNGRTSDQQDAYAAAAWLRQADLHGSLGTYLSPKISPDQLRAARIEGWILGVL